MIGWFILIVLTSGQTSVGLRANHVPMMFATQAQCEATLRSVAQPNYVRLAACVHGVVPLVPA